MNEFMEALCKDDLSKLRYYERRIAEIPDEIAEEQARLTSIKSSTTGSTPVQGGGNKREEWLVSALDRIDRLKADLRYFEGKVRLAYRALDSLDKDDQRILVVLYVDKLKRGADVLMDELDIDSRTVWRRRAGALQDYCTARYTNLENRRVKKTWLHFRHFGAALLQRSLANLLCCLRTLSCMHSGTNKPLRVKGGETD